MATVLASNKTKIAKRVIEVFEYFDKYHQRATVMDIVRKYGRPQSSTSELLTSLAEMGLLYKDPRSRSYSPTPRLASFGAAAQSQLIRDGRLFLYMDRLAFSSRCGVALFGMVGTHVQIFRWSPGGASSATEFGCGASEQLANSAAGLLLLSTLTSEQASRVLWRLSAEAPASAKFNPSEVGERVSLFRRQGHATGPAGFAPAVQVTATLLPRSGAERPLALGVTYPAESIVDANALLATLTRGIAQCAAEDEADVTPPAFAMAI